MRIRQSISRVTADQVNRAFEGNLRAVVSWSTPVAAYCTGAGAAKVIEHDLGKVPNIIAVEPYVDSRWWVDQDDRRIWTAAQIVLRTSHAGLFVVRAGVQ